jgi:hypothetical protein
VKELQTKITDQKQLVKDVKEEKKKMLKMCRQRIKMQEQENKKWKAETAASLSVKQQHAEKWLELEKSHVKERDADIDRFCKEKAAVEKSLGAERTAKEKLVRQVHSLKERASKRKSSDIDPMERVRHDQMRSEI